MSRSEPIVVIGMSRSGTTLLTNFLSLASSVRAILEPHLLWKAGSFSALDDVNVTKSPGDVNYIRRRLEEFAGDRRIVEKSPPNMLRPDFVHSAFPDARVLLIERDPVACIRSNLNRTKSQDTLSVKRLGNRYLGVGRRVGGPLSVPMKRASVTEQVRPADSLTFATYVARLSLLRTKGLLPFGPKLPGFSDIIQRHGLIEYYAQLYEAWDSNKRTFLDLYGSMALELRLEDFVEGMEERLREVMEFCEIPSQELSIKRAYETLRVDRITGRRSSVGDDEIRKRVETIRG